MEGREFNGGTPYGERRVYSRIPVIISPNRALSSRHYYGATDAAPGVKAGDWLIGERVTEADATHFLVHELTVLPASPADQGAS